MKIIKTQKEAEALVKNNVLAIDDHVTFECDISLNADIKARDINAGDISAWDINALDIKARDINAGDIGAWDINAQNISYYGVCFAYRDIVCAEIKGGHPNARHFSLSGKIIILDRSGNKAQIYRGSRTRRLKNES